MSKKKYRFKHRRATRSEFETSTNTPAQKREIVEETSNYDAISDFKSLFAIIIFYSGLVYALYQYDLQTKILGSLSEKLLSYF